MRLIHTHLAVLIYLTLKQHLYLPKLEINVPFTNIINLYVILKI